MDITLPIATYKIQMDVWKEKLDSVLVELTADFLNFAIDNDHDIFFDDVFVIKRYEDSIVRFKLGDVVIFEFSLDKNENIAISAGNYLERALRFKDLELYNICSGFFFNKENLTNIGFKIARINEAKKMHESEVELSKMFNESEVELIKKYQNGY